MKVKPKEVFVNLPMVLLFNTEDEIPQLASGFNTFLHGKVRLKYEVVGELNGQFVGLFYLQRNDESQQLRDEFEALIQAEEVAAHQAPLYLDPSKFNAKGMIIAYTIGHTGSYNKLLTEGPPERCQKMGAHDDYEGGYIWKTEEEAHNFIYSQAFLDLDWGDGLLRPPKNFSVYKVELVNGWQDVTPVPGKDGIYHLLVNSRFYK